MKSSQSQAYTHAIHRLRVLFDERASGKLDAFPGQARRGLGYLAQAYVRDTTCIVDGDVEWLRTWR